jgi:hypothetical protein
MYRVMSPAFSRRSASPSSKPSARQRIYGTIRVIEFVPRVEVVKGEVGVSRNDVVLARRCRHDGPYYPAPPRGEMITSYPAAQQS